MYIFMTSVRRGEHGLAEGEVIVAREKEEEEEEEGKEENDS